ncbi:hypothetical protein N7448_001571 [Penicillium atrosanguineum]|uniref:Cytochrome b-c1 complex subunit 10 n=1 Tax=Penicillium atrosanguineum TaxID=1132637 RepID=A0A9W9Q9J9_9EURO|nr:Prephenate dehydrogenase [Penicillium atrosanguineum]KAJ5149993.1 hypothetical protein N7448_001571 [Penicillium atrosanguineum]KAJ5305309.1 Prephenate dehydrogenase [Penicillium atrosanguineum]KAJ5324771.1 hypothetical protein N7476_003371 [Penicillium atrosanguineum]
MVFTPTLRRAAAQAPSAFGPKIHLQRSVAGFTLPSAVKAGTIAGSFGVAAGTFVVFFFGDIPRFNRDVIRQIPFLDAYYDNPVAPEDNPF